VQFRKPQNWPRKCLTIKCARSSVGQSICLLTPPRPFFPFSPSWRKPHLTPANTGRRACLTPFPCSSSEADFTPKTRFRLPSPMATGQPPRSKAGRGRCSVPRTVSLNDQAHRCPPTGPFERTQGAASPSAGSAECGRPRWRDLRGVGLCFMLCVGCTLSGPPPEVSQPHDCSLGRCQQTPPPASVA